MSRFFKQFCILESIDELELFTLHASHICLILCLLLSLSRQFFFKLLAGAILSLHELVLALLCRLLLLTHDHSLYLPSALLFISSLLLIHLSSCLLLHLSIQSDLFLSLLSCKLAILHSLIGHLLVLTIHLPFHSLIHLCLAHAFLFDNLILHISLPLIDYLIGTLACLINFLDDLFKISKQDD